MHGLVLGTIGGLLAALWLILLSATNFSAVVICAGLLVMVGLIGRGE